MCYNCKYSAIHKSDITLADFWGYRRFNSAINDGKGLSLMLANTLKGNEVLTNLTDKMQIEKLPSEFSEYSARRDGKEYDINKRAEFYEFVKKSRTIKKLILNRNKIVVATILNKLIKK